jgi:putative methyltransferase (TIGR04325 family)
MKLRKFAEAWIPPRAREIYNRLGRFQTWYSGPYQSFADALDKSSGYADPSIAARLSVAAKSVLSGAAAYAQDGKVFPATPPPQYALSGLLLTAARARRPISVLDVGGGLASHYLRWRPFLSRMDISSWDVVEQESMVAAGRTLFGDYERVRFHQQIGDTNSQPDAALLSSVLQYVKDPGAMLQSTLARNPSLIIFDRTPSMKVDSQVHLVQHNPSIQGSPPHSYPITVFPREWLAHQLGPRYELVTAFPSPDAPVVCGRLRAEFSGSIWLRRD